MKTCFAVLISCLILLAPALAVEDSGRVYDETRDARAQIDAALAEAGERGMNALLVFGANWCHDSRGLAARLTGEGQIGQRAEGLALRFIDVGERDRNLDQLARFGVAWMFGTPSVLVVSPDGALLNADSVHDWRLADSAAEADIAAFLATYSGAEQPGVTAHGDLDALARGWAPLRARLEAIEAGEGDEAEKVRQRAYALGFARSRARAVMGEWEEANGPIADSAALDEPDPDLDRTGELAALMAEHRFLPAERYSSTGE